MFGAVLNWLEVRRFVLGILEDHLRFPPDILKPNTISIHLQNEQGINN
jgi:hypothetical protein